MKVTAIADAYIPAELLEPGVEKLRQNGHQVTIVPWGASSKEELQELNLDIEQHGPAGHDLPEELADQVRASNIVITQFAPINADLIAQCKDLKLIGVLRGGTENVDSAAATKAGIKVVNTPGRNARAVAEFAVGMILAETRNIARTHAAMKQNVWLKDFPNSADIPELEGKTVGIVGAGNIGRLVIKFLSGMDMKCIYFDPYTDSVPGAEKFESLEDLVAESDVVTLHSRLTSENHHLIDEKILSLMKPSAVLVNTARSGLVDEQALLEALRSGKIMGAAIDTFDVEPLDADSAWLKLDNVTLTSHLAGTTADAFKKTPFMLSQRILDALAEMEG